MLPPGELTCIKLATVRAQKLHIFWRYLSWSSFCPFVACLLIALENHSFYWSKCYYRTFDMFRAQNFSCSNKTVPCSPSQGNSCTVNGWDTWFYSAYVLPPNSLDLNPVDYCVWNLLQERVYYCTKVDNVVDLKQHIVAEWAALDHSIIASAIAQWHLRLHACVLAAGEHCEHCLQWHYPLFM